VALNAVCARVSLITTEGHRRRASLPLTGYPAGGGARPLATLRVHKADRAGRRLFGPGHAPLDLPHSHHARARMRPTACRLRTRGGQDGVAKAWSPSAPRRLKRHDQPGTPGHAWPGKSCRDHLQRPCEHEGRATADTDIVTRATIPFGALASSMSLIESSLQCPFCGASRTQVHSATFAMCRKITGVLAMANHCGV
jgi:hypothetical protein